MGCGRRAAGGRVRGRRWKQGLSAEAFNQTKGLKDIDIYMHGGFAITVSLFPVDFSLN